MSPLRAIRDLARAERGQASVELVALLPLTLIVGIAILAVLAARAAAGQAAAAAQAGAMALIQDGDPREAARAALPATPATRDDRRPRPRVIVHGPAGAARPFLGDAFAATASAHAGPAASRASAPGVATIVAPRQRWRVETLIPPYTLEPPPETAPARRVTGAAPVDLTPPHPRPRRPPVLERRGRAATPPSAPRQPGGVPAPRRRPGDARVARAPTRRTARPRAGPAVLVLGSLAVVPVAAACAGELRARERAGAAGLCVLAAPAARDAPPSADVAGRDRPPRPRGRDDARRPAPRGAARRRARRDRVRTARLGRARRRPGRGRRAGAAMPARRRGPGRARRRRAAAGGVRAAPRRRSTSPSPCCRPTPTPRCARSRSRRSPPRAASSSRRCRRARRAGRRWPASPASARCRAEDRADASGERRRAGPRARRPGRSPCCSSAGCCAVGRSARWCSAPSRAGSARATPRSARPTSPRSAARARCTTPYARLFEPPLVAGRPNPRHLEKEAYLALGRAAAARVAARNGAPGAGGRASPTARRSRRCAIRVAVERRVVIARQRRARCARGARPSSRRRPASGRRVRRRRRLRRPARAPPGQADAPRRRAGVRPHGGGGRARRRRARDRQRLPLGRRAGGPVRAQPGPEVGRAARQVAAPQRDRARPRAACGLRAGSPPTRRASTSSSATRGSRGTSATR